ncbi:MAG TPA: hypothetical protein PKY88_00860 [Anaerohalosphaeraceae bacterium]|nr:hypothetical protein [Anaerohalosphaeraceae bacterium]
MRATGLVFLLFTGTRFVYNGIVLVSSLFFGCQYGIFEKTTYALSAAVEMLFLAGLYYCLLRPAKFLLSLCRIPPLDESHEDMNRIIAALLVKCLGIWFFLLGLRELVFFLFLLVGHNRSGNAVRKSPSAGDSSAAVFFQNCVGNRQRSSLFAGWVLFLFHKKYPEYSDGPITPTVLFQDR